MVKANGLIPRLLLLISVTLLIGWVHITAVQAQQGPTNLLVNGDFEWVDPALGRWPYKDGIPEVQVCPGWRAFYLDNPPPYAQVPEYWRRPEFRDVIAGEFPDRVRSGHRAAKYFSFAGQHEAGFYQQVSGITPGTPLRFSVYMQTWSCMPADEWNICPTGTKSNEPAPMRTKVGIDPTGGTNPWAATVVWSPEIEAYDVWTYFQVEATAQHSTVTVFTYSRADWTDTFFRVHNDVYVDDASLIALDEVLPVETPEPDETPEPAPPTATPDPALPTATPIPTATPVATATPRPDGAVVHIVQEGNTLRGIARQYQVPLETLLQLNALTNADMILVGQGLVISVPEPTSTPTPTATSVPELPTPTPTTSIDPTIPPTATLLPTPTATETAIVDAATPLPSNPTPETENPAIPWGWIWLSVILLCGAGAWFVFGRK